MDIRLSSSIVCPADRGLRAGHPPTAPSRLVLALGLGATLLLPGALHAQGLPAETVVVTGSLAERAAAEAPYAIAVVDRDALRLGGPQVNLSESLARVPGLVVNNRSNYAQDLQISSRGFGALYLQHIRQAHEGCDFDFLQGTAPTAEPEIH